MKEPKEVVGFVVIDETEHAFELDTEKYLLSVFPLAESRWGFREEIELFNKRFEPKKPRWIPNKRIVGRTFDSKGIIIDVTDNPSIRHGLQEYEVHWFYLFEDQLTETNISGFRVRGPDIDRFYPSKNAFKTSVAFNEEQRKVEKITVETTEYKKQPCGKYRVDKHLDAIIEVAAFGGTNWDNPFYASSELIITFSSYTNVSTLVKTFYNIITLFQFVTYRKNIQYNRVDVFTVDKDGKKQNNGLLYVDTLTGQERHRHADLRIIEYNLLRTRTAKLLTAIKNHIISTECFCSSIDDTRHYSPERMIMILSYFECTYENIHGKDRGRSELYVSTKNEIVDMLAEYEKSAHGQKRGYIKDLRKYVDNRNSSFKDAVKNSLIDNETVMKPIVCRSYSIQPRQYNKTITYISDRLGELRNSLAHSKLNFKFHAVDLSDINIVEILLYVMRLKKIGMKDEDILKAVNNLFHLQLGI